MAKKRSQNKRAEQSRIQSNQDAYEYDLNKNFRRVGRYSDSGDSQTSSENIQEGNSRQLSSDYQDKSRSTYTGASNDRYDRLDDKIQSLSDKNDSAHTNLRQELEGKIDIKYQNLETKIDKKLSTQWYSWTVGALVVITGMIYLLSYSGLIKNVDSHDREISNAMNRIKIIEKYNTRQDIKPTEIPSKIDTLNKN